MRLSEKFMLVFKITNLIWWRWGAGILEHVMIQSKSVAEGIPERSKGQKT